MDATFGREGLPDVNAMCFSVRVVGTELVDSVNDFWLLVGDDGVCGIDSSGKRSFKVNFSVFKCFISQSNMKL